LGRYDIVTQNDLDMWRVMAVHNGSDQITGDAAL